MGGDGLVPRWMVTAGFVGCHRQRHIAEIQDAGWKSGGTWTIVIPVLRERPGIPVSWNGGRPCRPERRASAIARTSQESPGRSGRTRAPVEKAWRSGGRRRLGRRHGQLGGERIRGCRWPAAETACRTATFASRTWNGTGEQEASEQPVVAAPRLAVAIPATNPAGVTGRQPGALPAVTRRGIVRVAAVPAWCLQRAHPWRSWRFRPPLAATRPPPPRPTHQPPATAQRLTPRSAGGQHWRQLAAA